MVQVAAVGEGQCRPSWIWFIGVDGAESMDDPLMHQGEFYILSPWLELMHDIVLCVE